MLFCFTNNSAYQYLFLGQDSLPLFQLRRRMAPIQDIGRGLFRFSADGSALCGRFLPGVLENRFRLGLRRLQSTGRRFLRLCLNPGR